MDVGRDRVRQLERDLRDPGSRQGLFHAGPIGVSPIGCPELEAPRTVRSTRRDEHLRMDEHVVAVDSVPVAVTNLDRQVLSTKHGLQKQGVQAHWEIRSQRGA